MYLVISEKPSVSQSIGKVIGAYKRENGYLEGRDCIVSWCLGHLAEYAPPEAYDEKYAKWKLEDLPIFPDEWQLAVTKDKKEQFEVLKKLLNRTDLEYVVNACDAGREGELIFQRVYNLSGSRLPVKRLWISSMEDSAIKEGFSQLKDGSVYENLCRAAICRAQADWLVGMNATRAFTTVYHHRLTVGRVQTPTLAMLAERGRQIAEFRKEKYYKLHLACGDLEVIKDKIFDQNEAGRLKAACDGAMATVEDVVSAEKVVRPPRLYDLTTLQRESNRLYGYTAKQTLDFVQSLYEKKLATYPRTDSQFLSDDMEDTAKTVIQVILEKYEIASAVYPAEPDVKRVMDNRKVSDHHAIISTAELKTCDLSSLSKGERDILLLIARRLLCATAQKHVSLETCITVSCAGELFTAKGRVVKEEGWKALEKAFVPSGKQTEDGENFPSLLPQVARGEKFEAVSASMTEHFTSPPKPYSEDTLLATMETAGNKEFDEGTEKKGLGTPATRAGIIEKLVASGFAKRSGKQIVITESGAELIAVMPENLKSAGMTASWENQLMEMEKGETAPEAFMDGIRGMVTSVVEGCGRIPQEERQRFESREQIGTCPVCHHPVYEGKNNFYCSNRDCRFVLWKENRYLESMKKKLDSHMAKALLSEGKVHLTKLYSAKKDSYFDADILLDTTDGRANFRMEFPKKPVKKAAKKK